MTGTFTYGGGRAKCTSVTPSAAAIASTWKVSDISGSESRNKAGATADGKQYADGKVVQTMTRTVTLTLQSDRCVFIVLISAYRTGFRHSYLTRRKLLFYYCRIERRWLKWLIYFD